MPRPFGHCIHHLVLERDDPDLCRLPMSSVREFMHKGLITCPPAASLAKAAALLREHLIHGVIVTDEHNHPVGVVSDTDLLAGEWLGGTPENLAIMRAMTAGELMTKPVATIPAGTTPAEAAAELRRKHVARLVVTDGSDPIGVISVSDLLAAIPRDSSRRELVRHVMSWGYVACHPNTPIVEAARAMLERNSRSLVVLGRGGKLAGVVTGFDLLGSLIDASQRYRVVADYMSPAVTTLPDARLTEAIDLMLTKEIHRVIVLDPDVPEGPPLGLISTTDIVVEMASPGSAWRM